MIVPVRSPAAANTIVRRVLDDLLPDRLANWREVDDGQARIVSLPIHAVAATSVAHGRWGRSWSRGWRFLWTHPRVEQGAVIEIARAQRGVRLAASAWGASAPRQVAALDALVLSFGADERGYRPRLLRLAWIGIEAIWLAPADRQGPGHFQSLAETRAGSREDIQRRAAAFLAEASAQARNRGSGA